ncbi:MAG: APC family permease [Gemmatimonadota bacterium]
MSLRRTLGTTDLSLLVIGNVIGSGIFIVPSTVLRQAGGDVTLASLVWLAGGLLSLMGALSYAELGSMQKGNGGLYAYIREGFGPFPAFLYGWTLFFVIGAGTIATLVVAAAGYMTQFMPLTPIQRKLIAVLLVLAICIVNIRGTRQSASLQNVATAIKVGAIMVLSALFFTLGDSNLTSTPSPEPTSVAAIGLAMVSVLWAYEGWQYVTFSDSEAVDPQRTLPRAIVLGTVALIAIYLIANFGYLVAIGADRVMASERVAGEAATSILGPTAGALVAVAIIISMVSAAHATVITAPRVFYNMAADGLSVPAMATVHPRFGTPAVAILASCAWAAVLALTGTFEQLLTWVVFVGWIFYALGAAAVIALRYKRPDAERPFRVPLYPLTPILFVLAGAAIVVNTVMEQPVQSLIGVAVVLLGAPAYLVLRRPVWGTRAP